MRRHPGSSWRNVDHFSLELGGGAKRTKWAVGWWGCAESANASASANSHSHLENSATTPPPPAHSLSLSPFLPSFLPSLPHRQPSSPFQSLLVCFSILPSSRRIKIGATSPRSSRSPPLCCRPRRRAGGRAGERASVSGFTRWPGVSLRPFLTASGPVYLWPRPLLQCVEQRTEASWSSSQSSF